MAYCNKCGKEVGEGDTFCHACGAAMVAGGGTGGDAAPPAVSAPLPPGFPAAAPMPPLAAQAYPEQAGTGSPREIAERRVNQRMELWWHLGSYVIVNVFLVIIWAITGAGYPWFVWVMLGWGIGVVFHIMHYLLSTHGDTRRQSMIEKEINRLQRKQGTAERPRPPQEKEQERE
jgi:hypothetical protein